MKQLIFTLAATIILSASVASAQGTVDVMIRSTLNDYGYAYGNGLTAGNNAPANTGVFADFTNTIAGEFPGFGSGGSDGGVNSPNVVDPTVAGQSLFTVMLDIEGNGAADPNATYQYRGELQFQDIGNTAGVNPAGTSNINNVILVQFDLFYDGTIAGPQTITETIDLTSLTPSQSFARGTINDIVTLLNAGELDDVAININAGQGTDFYGMDDDASFSTSNVLVTQSVVSQAIPEPSSLALLGLLGIAGIGARRRR